MEGVETYNFLLNRFLKGYSKILAHCLGTCVCEVIDCALALSTFVNSGLGSAECACTEAWRWINAMLSEAEEQLPSGAGELVP